MRLLRKKEIAPLNAIKLYSTSPPRDRGALVGAILKTIHEIFGDFPAEFDIHGPYGIRKGTTVGLKAFQNKLAKKGHDGYYALDGKTPGHFGFHLMLDARTGETTYSELIVWYASEQYEVDFLSLAKPLLEPLNASCGFEIEIPSDHLVTTETKIRTSIFGTTSVEVNGKHLTWISSINQGLFRGLFKNNILNDVQLKSVFARTEITSISIGNGLHFVHHLHAQDRI